MSGEDQERFEDYLELERYIEELQAGHAARPPKDLTPDQARLYRTAALFRSASPESASPRPEFANELYARLLALEDEDQDEETQKRPVVTTGPRSTSVAAPVMQTEQTVVPVQKAPQEQVIIPAQEVPQEQAVPEPPAVSRRSVAGKGRVVSRRSLLAGGATAAASMAAGVALGAAFKPGAAPQQSGHVTATPTPPVYGKFFLLHPDIPTDLHYVATVTELVSKKVVKFATDTLVGYVRMNDGDDKAIEGTVVAMSAACTHMGCTVDWNPSDDHYHCPCHGGLFAEYGKPVQGPTQYMMPLPLLRAHVMDNGKIYVEVPRALSKPGSAQSWEA
ncbi:MAG TPA: Rieske 2Fe-2S domain-containing protein [Ktedonosporobacter sp.]|nr:Rieske 2Fe-2S domain-containing protein [Ktedonosporobacter sp.]